MEEVLGGILPDYAVYILLNNQAGLLHPERTTVFVKEQEPLLWIFKMLACEFWL